MFTQETIDNMNIKDLYGVQVSSWIEKTRESNLSSKDKEKRILELCHFASFGIALLRGNFISSIDELEIIESSIEPDFIIKYKGELIGVELARLVNGDVEKYGARRKLLKQSARLFVERYPGVNLLANIGFNDCFDARINDTETLRSEIADFVFKTFSGQDTERPSYIERIVTMKHSRIDFELSGAYIVGGLDIENLNSTIERKCGKADNYRNKSGLDKLWLLLIVSGASPDSDYSYIDFESIRTGEAFDSIYLLNDFDKETFKLS